MRSSLLFFLLCLSVLDLSLSQEVSGVPSLAPVETAGTCVLEQNIENCPELIKGQNPIEGCSCYNFCGDRFTGCCPDAGFCDLACDTLAFGEVVTAGCQLSEDAQPVTPAPAVPTPPPTRSCMVTNNAEACPALTANQESIEGCDCYNYCGTQFQGCCDINDMDCTASCSSLGPGEVLTTGCQLTDPDTPPPTPAVPIRLYGFNYNIRQGRTCKSREQVLTELTVLKRITDRIRLTSLTDCEQGKLVLNVAKQAGLQVWLGLRVSDNPGFFNIEKQTLERLLDEGLVEEDLVLGITVGSESVYRMELTASEIIFYRNQIREVVTSANANVPISIAEVASIYQQYPSLTEAVDVIVANSIQFDENITIENSVQQLFDDLTGVLNQTQAQGKDLIIGGTGWPSEGFLEGAETAIPQLQVQYFREFYCKMDRELNWKYYYFTAIDKDPSNSLEDSWGIMYANLTIKPHFENLVFECDDGVEYSFDWALPSRQPSSEPSSQPSSKPSSFSAEPSLQSSSQPSSELSSEPSSSNSSQPSSKPPVTVAPVPTSAPVGESDTCKAWGSSCGAYTDCCSQRCLFGSCQTPAPRIETRQRISQGRGGAAGRAKTAGRRTLVDNRRLHQTIRGQ